MWLIRWCGGHWRPFSGLGVRGHLLCKSASFCTVERQESRLTKLCFSLLLLLLFLPWGYGGGGGGLQLNKLLSYSLFEKESVMVLNSQRRVSFKLVLTENLLKKMWNLRPSYEAVKGGLLTFLEGKTNDNVFTQNSYRNTIKNIVKAIHTAVARCYPTRLKILFLSIVTLIYFYHSIIPCMVNLYLGFYRSWQALQWDHGPIMHYRRQGGSRELDG